MKKLFLILFFLITPFITHGASEHIEHFDAAISIQESSRISVTETITYDFGEEERHGIFRWIPLRTVVGGVSDLEIDNILVTDEEGKPYPIADISKSSESVNIKIGDANVFIAGIHTYVISYTVDRAIGYFDTYDELYWNVTGTEWEVPINSVSAKITLPTEVQESDLILNQYCGSYGESSLCGDIQASTVDGKTVVSFESGAGTYFYTGEGVTLSVGFPKNIVSVIELKWWEKTETYIYLFFGITAFFILSFLFWIFNYYIPKKRELYRPIITEYTPPEDMTPSVLGCIYNNGGVYTARSATADMLYLAQKEVVGISMGEREKTNTTKKGVLLLPALLFGVIIFFFSKIFFFGLLIWGLVNYKKVRQKISLALNPIPFTFTQKTGIDAYPKHLKTLYSIFTDTQPVTLKELKKKKLYKKFDRYAEEVGEVADIQNEKKVMRDRSAFVVVTAFILGLAAMIVTIFFVDIPEKASVILSACLMEFIVLGIISFSIKQSLRKKLRSRTDLWYKAAGLYQYIKTAEKDRIAFASDPEKSRHVFSELLPYAVVFKLEKKWTKIFEGIVLSPEWSTQSNGFSTALFISSFNTSVQGVSNAGRPTSSGSGSSGGGSSGGGGGGGGGGSW